MAIQLELQESLWNRKAAQISSKKPERELRCPEVCSYINSTMFCSYVKNLIEYLQKNPKIGENPRDSFLRFNNAQV